MTRHLQMYNAMTRQLLILASDLWYLQLPTLLVKYTMNMEKMELQSLKKMEFKSLGTYKSVP